jgi:heme A synthase
MRRGTPLKTRLARAALAYLLALQAVLGAWAVHAAASSSIDPALTLCRTTPGGGAQQSGDDAVPAAHCVAMCLSGACGVGDPPAAVGAEADFASFRTAAISIRFGRDRLPAGELHVTLNARGPPSIV